MASVVDETVPRHLPDDPRPGDDRPHYLDAHRRAGDRHHCPASADAAADGDAAAAADARADAVDAAAEADAPNSSRGDTKGARGNSGPNSHRC